MTTAQDSFITMLIRRLSVRDLVERVGANSPKRLIDVMAR